jgi:protein-tyrosine phosphatase
VIDLHSHILPGLDDGVDSLEEARELARLVAAEGVEAIAATPHVRNDFPTTVEQMERGVAELREDFAAAGIELDVLHGGEIALERLDELTREELERFTLAQTGRYLLLETPYVGSPLALAPAVGLLRSSELFPVIAHPERNADVQRRPELLESLVELGALVQITAASLDGRFGRPSRRAAKALMKLRLAHLIASDAHSPNLRAAGLSAAARALRDRRLAAWLTIDVPAAVVAGADPPPRPSRDVRSRRLFRR